ncbi:MAG: PBP1A family penicillin-binding protein [Desulfobacterales bacterium]|nr:PBP1A family penicillin-binding protein [Desulfobacterales bacterium]
MIRCLRTLFYAGLTLTGLGAVAGMIFFFTAIRELPRVPEPLSRIIETPPTEIFAASGERLLVIGGREAVPISRVSSDFINAVVATEDHRFWRHHGINKLRIVKALGITLFVPGKIQGASTITQQLAKNLFFSFRRSYMRKFRELLVALQIEAQFGKEEILEAYINQIAFNARSHGIEQAARTFFGKAASELNLAEAALLAGMPKSPTRYNPYRHWERAKQRQEVVLGRMVSAGHITRAQANDAFLTPIDLVAPRERADTGSYFLDMVIRDLETTYGADIVHHGGLKVYTTLDPRLQLLATEAIQRGLKDLDGQLRLPAATPPTDTQTEKPQGALAAIDTKSGALRALVGGRAYHESAYNRAIHNQRQPGSGFKPFTYYTAFEKLDLSPATLVVDQPVIIPVKGSADWQPRNFNREFGGPMVLKLALMKSVNTVAAQLIEQVDPARVIDTARRCGIESALAPFFSLALGTSGVSPLEMAGAFATFANGGVHHRPYWIARVEDARGRILRDHIVSGRRVLDPVKTFQLVDMMRGVIDQGSGAVVRRLGFERPAAGKTGTTNNYHDAWFTGFTPTLSASVWVGFDRAHALKDTRGVGITGGRGAAPIWTAFMLKAVEGEPTRHFTVPPGIHFEMIDPQTGRRPDALTREPLQVALTAGQMPDGSMARRETGALTIPPAAERLPGTEGPSGSGIVEEDLPLDD